MEPDIAEEITPDGGEEIAPDSAEEEGPDSAEEEGIATRKDLIFLSNYEKNAKKKS